MEREFTKMHGLGNDFVVFDGIDNPIRLDAEALQRLADRRLGIGCDQVLVLENAGTSADARLRIFNADGSEVEQCGNGMRCVAEYLRRRRQVCSDPVRLETGAGRIEVFADGCGWRVNMGVPEFDPARIPLNAGRRSEVYRIDLAEGPVEVHALSMGNPHAVLVVPDVRNARVETLAPALQKSGAFPRGVNVGFMEVVAVDRVQLRVYERGVGETLACGSGACAAVVAGRLYDGLEPEVDVGLKGGHLRIRWAGEGEPVWMTGPATTVFEGRIDL
jgi:diaminopimelate epimerase